MSYFFWSVLEKMLQRGLTVVMSLLMAYLLSPREVGVYGVAIALLTLVQMLGDISLRQVGSIFSRNGKVPFVVRRAIWATAAASSVTAAGLLTVEADVLGAGHFLEIIPLCLVPVASAVGTDSYIQTQLRHEFRRQAIVQVMATSVSLTITLPILFASRSLVAASIQFLLSEGLFSVVLRRRATRVISLQKDESLDAGAFKRVWLPNSAMNLLAWGQSQLDRVLMLVVASASTVGLYGLAVSLTRTISDVLLLSIANIARPLLGATDDTLLRNARFNTIIRIVAFTTAFASVALCTVVGPLASRLLGGEWERATEIIPILAMAIPIAGFNWVAQSLMLVEGKIARNIVPSVLGVLLCVVVALAGRYSLSWAAVAASLREFVMLPFRAGAIHERLDPATSIGSVLAAVLAISTCVIVFVANGNETAGLVCLGVVVPILLAGAVRSYRVGDLSLTNGA